MYGTNWIFSSNDHVQNGFFGLPRSWCDIDFWKEMLSVQNVDKVAGGGLDVFSEYPRPAASPLWVRGIQKTILALDKGWNFFRSRIQHLVRTLSRRNLSKPCHDIVKTNLTNLIDKACFEMLIYGRSCNFNIFILGPLRPH